MGLVLVENENPKNNRDMRVIWSADGENYPSDLVQKVVEHISKKGFVFKDVAVGFFQNIDKDVRMCAVSILFTISPNKYRTQHVIFRKRKGEKEWLAIQESEIMSSKIEDIKQLDDPDLVWDILED